MSRKDRDSVMHARHLFLAMSASLLVLAVMTYVVSGSIMTMVLRTALSSIGLQAAYFAVVIYLVLYTAKPSQTGSTPNRESDEAPRTFASSRKNADL